MEGYKAGNQLVTYLYKPTLYVFSQLEGEIGYGIKCECPWEPEHQCSIEICGGEPNERKNLSQIIHGTAEKVAENRLVTVF